MKDFPRNPVAAEDVGLGFTVRDRVTGFTGICTGRAEYLTGCTQICVVPKTADPAKSSDVSWFDWQRLELVDTGLAEIAKTEASKAKNGGPQDTPKGSKHP